MKLVIDIPEEVYKRIKSLSIDDYFEHDICGNSMRRIANGKPFTFILSEMKVKIIKKKGLKIQATINFIILP